MPLTLSYYRVEPWPGTTPEALADLLNTLHDQGYWLSHTLTDGKRFYLVFKRDK